MSFSGERDPLVPLERRRQRLAGELEVHHPPVTRPLAPAGGEGPAGAPWEDREDPALSRHGEPSPRPASEGPPTACRGPRGAVCESLAGHDRPPGSPGPLILAQIQLGRRLRAPDRGSQTPGHLDQGDLDRVEEWVDRPDGRIAAQPSPAGASRPHPPGSLRRRSLISSSIPDSGNGNSSGTTLVERPRSRHLGDRTRGWTPEGRHLGDPATAATGKRHRTGDRTRHSTPGRRRFADRARGWTRRRRRPGDRTPGSTPGRRRSAVSVPGAAAPGRRPTV